MTARAMLGAVLSTVLLTAAACTDERPGPSPATPTSQTPATTPEFGVGRAALGCADATTSNGGDTGGGPFELRLTDTVVSAPPRAEDVGLVLPEGLHWYFRKEPLSLAAGDGDVTLSVDGPGQAVAWVSAPVWTSGRPPHLGDWAAASVTLSSCPDRAAMFLGGLLAADLDTCIHLTVRQVGQPEQTVRLRLDGSACSD